MFELHDDGSVTVRLSPEDTMIVQELVRSGRFASPGDVVVAAVRRAAAERRWRARIEAEDRAGLPDEHSFGASRTVEARARERTQIEARLGGETEGDAG